MSLIWIPVTPARFAGLLGAGVAIFTAGPLVLDSPAMAKTPIGSATVVLNDVRGHTGGEIVRINRGDNVVLDQLVQTAANSQAKIVFLDTTNMSVGPDSIVKLDQFVYNGNGTAQTVSINATKGAFRFFSGNSEHRAYKVTTPQAVIGVRGTTYDVLIANGRTIVKLQEGAVTACVRSGASCRDLDQPGQYLVVNDTSVEGPYNGAGGWDFGSLCSGGASGLCNKTQFAMNNPPPSPPPAAGGRFQPPPRMNVAPVQTYTPPRAPPVRTASLPPPVYNPPVYNPPVYIPPYPRRPPVVHTPPVYVPPVYVPPVYVPPTRPPGRPPHTTPTNPRPYPPGRPPYPGTEGKPKPGTPGTTPGSTTGSTGPILRTTRGAGGIYGAPGSRWGNPNRFNYLPRQTANQRYGANAGNRGTARQAQNQRMITPRMTSPRLTSPRLNAPRVSSGQRMASISRTGNNNRRR